MYWPIRNCESADGPDDFRERFVMGADAGVQFCQFGRESLVI